MPARSDPKLRPPLLEPCDSDLSETRMGQVLDGNDVVGDGGPLDESGRRVKDRVLSLEVVLCHPTGDRATTSNKNGDLVFYDRLEYFAEWRPTDRQDARDHFVSDQHHRVAN